jgi:ubiquinone/menaquinone biosynthesis C-methylase UbiE
MVLQIPIVRAIKEIHRVLKAGGPFYAMDISQRFFPPEALFSKEEFIQQLEANELTVLRTAGNNMVFHLAGAQVVWKR